MRITTEAKIERTSKRLHPAMNAVYVVIENGDPYPNVYTSFTSAVATVKVKYKEVAEELSEEDGSICSELDVPENASGKTYLYIEKGIHIYIFKLPVLEN